MILALQKRSRGSPNTLEKIFWERRGHAPADFEALVRTPKAVQVVKPWYARFVLDGKKSLL